MYEKNVHKLIEKHKFQHSISDIESTCKQLFK